MANDLIVRAERRAVLGKAVRRLRRRGLTPANLFGPEIESLALQIETRFVQNTLERLHRAALIDLYVDGEGPRTVLLKGIERLPRTLEVAHVDFYQVPRGKPISAEVPLRLVGESPAVRQGGVLFHPLTTLEVQCLPRDLPEWIDVDLSRLVEIDDAIHVGDLALPVGVTTRADPETLVAKVMPPTVEREEAEAAAEAAATEAEATEREAGEE